MFCLFPVANIFKYTAYRRVHSSSLCLSTLCGQTWLTVLADTYLSLLRVIPGDTRQFKGHIAHPSSRLQYRHRTVHGHISAPVTTTQPPRASARSNQHYTALDYTTPFQRKRHQESPPHSPHHAMAQRRRDEADPQISTSVTTPQPS